MKAASTQDAIVVGAGPAGATAANYLAASGKRVALLEFGAAMTGVKPKTAFLKPAMALPMTIEVFRQVFRQKLLGDRSGRAAYRARAVEDVDRATASQNACLLDSSVRFLQ